MKSLIFMERSIPNIGFKRRGMNVHVEKLIKIYRSGEMEVQALRGVTATFTPGQITCIMGPSGSGKTTLLNLIGGIDRPTGGIVRIDNIDLTKLGERDLELHRLYNIGFVFQALNLIPVLTAIENIELPMALAGIGKDDRRKRALWLLDLVGLKDKAERYPEELSGGEQQRVAIAIALANDPPIILADEPTAELDSSNAKIVIDILIKLAKEAKKTIILATHDPRIAIRTDRILRLEDGIIVGEYTPLDLERTSLSLGVIEGTAQVNIAEVIKMRIAKIEKEIMELESKYKEGSITLEELTKRVSKLKKLKEALEDLLISIGGQ